MECSQIDLYDFLAESELQHYYNAIKNELKITSAAQLKYASDEDLKHIGLSRPEIRRLRKFYEKHFPHGYLSKIKRLLQAPATIVKRDSNDGSATLSITSPHAAAEPSSASASSPSKVPNNKHIIPADSIIVNKQLGTGEFGIVQQGVWTNGTERIQVAIKCLCRERMQSNPMEFLKEAAIMHSIEHENIVRLYGVVLATDSLMLVTELAHLRSLLECLKDAGLRVSFLTIPTLCEFAMQICNGMRYLENKRLIHRDLAARNILVFSKDKVKISDFGLSRALGVGKDYYKTNFNVNLKLPIAWCAPECINYLRFTNASDVWAYGVCLWEMFSYGFQPWAALTGLQILEAIDAPNYQRLEQPDCCPREYYTLMIKCWQDDPMKRPKFNEIYEILPDMKPEQLKAAVHCLEPKKDHLLYRQGDIITVLDRNTGTPFWKGVLHSGKTGFFTPSNTVAHLEGLPSSNRDSFCRISERSSKRKLRTEMISKPQNDLKHTGHVGIDGASFGDIAFLGNSQSYNHVPRQIVTPYKPSEDIEQTPLLLPPTPTSPDSLQTASGYFPEEAHGTSMNPSFVSSTENTPKDFASGRQPTFEFPGQTAKGSPGAVAFTNPFANKDEKGGGSAFALQNNNYGSNSLSFQTDGMHKTHSDTHWTESSRNGIQDQHEYHEISDDEIAVDKLDFGPSLLDEINSMFGSMSSSVVQPKINDFEHVNKRNDLSETSSKLVNKNSLAGDANGNKFTSSSKKKSAGTVKPISVKDEKILNQAIEIANEISARSMNDLVSDQPANTQSPKRKFSFRFPHLTGSAVSEKSNSSSPLAGGNGSGNNSAQQKSVSPYSKKKNFTEELESIPDLQAIIGEEGREAYNSLIERKAMVGTGMGLSPAANFLRRLDTNEFELPAAKTLPRCSMHLHDKSDCRTAQRFPIYRGDDQELVAPLQHAPRPMTLPSRGAAGRVKKLVECGLENGDHHFGSAASACNGATDSMSPPCESPSYLSNAFYNFPEKADANPLPLPPREGKKHIKANAKRHVRKYPLIIPANGVQRTLNKVTEQVPGDDGPLPAAGSLAGGGGAPNAPLKIVKYEVVASIRANAKQHSSHPVAHTYQNLAKVPSAALGADSASLQFESILEADFNTGNVLQSPDVTDGFYNFSIQKEHYNKGKSVDFDSKKISGLYVNEDELRNLDIEQSLKVQSSAVVPTQDDTVTQLEVSTQAEGVTTVDPSRESAVQKAKISSTTAAENELADNALFKKVRESVDLAMDKHMMTVTPSSTISPADSEADSKIPLATNRQQTEAEYFAAATARLIGSNSVSCEDLLEFSDKKPRGCERGVDSDEVRIMMKVLGKDAAEPVRCLRVLEFINWDVHKSIKVIKLQNILPTLELSLSASVEALQQQEWDLHATALKLKNRMH